MIQIWDRNFHVWHSIMARECEENWWNFVSLWFKNKWDWTKRVREIEKFMIDEYEKEWKRYKVDRILHKNVSVFCKIHSCQSKLLSNNVKILKIFSFLLIFPITWMKTNENFLTLQNSHIFFFHTYLCVVLSSWQNFNSKIKYEFQIFIFISFSLTHSFSLFVVLFRKCGIFSALFFFSTQIQNFVCLSAFLPFGSDCDITQKACWQLNKSSSYFNRIHRQHSNDDERRLGYVPWNFKNACKKLNLFDLEKK
jgi:hypothetical protein